MAGFSTWDDRYDTRDYVYGTDPNDFLRSVADRIPRGRVLSLGEGEGRNGVFLAGLGFDVVAVDQSAVGLKKAERLAASRGVRIRTVRSSLADFEIRPREWDGIISIFCHLPSVQRRIVHRGVAAGLAYGGVLVLEAYTPEQIGRGTGGPPVVDRTMTLGGLRSELPGLVFEIAREVDREVLEGRFHTGDGAVVQLLARRPAPDEDSARLPGDTGLPPAAPSAGR